MHFLFEDKSKGIAQLPVGPRTMDKPVHFHAYRNSSFNFFKKIVNYDGFQYKNGNMDLVTGRFKAPVAGYYRFYFQVGYIGSDDCVRDHVKSKSLFERVPKMI
jgi:hypothetical protein